MGCIGMSVDDFCRCTPSEFKAVYEGWANAEQRHERAEWERIRLQTACMLQPYSRHALKPQDVLRFDWDDESDAVEGEKLSAKEIRERFEAVKREQGLQ